ncbi:MAG: acyl-CoA dehydrogenase family protein [Rhodospirillales bacterium]|jgi:alkylation response protein AidB-like acyl-CoA dehydrogenase
MDLTFTEEQTMAAEAVRRLLGDVCRPEDLRRSMASGADAEPARWAALAGMGLCGLLAPEAAGGLALDPVDFVLVAEACGHAALPEPIVEHAGVAVPLLAAMVAADDPLLAEAVSGGALLTVAHPANPFVADAESARAVLSLGPDGARIAPPAGLVRLPGIDPFRRLSALAVAAAAGPPVAGPDIARPAFDAAFERGAVFAAAQLVGIAQRAVDLAAAYAKERRQFGKPIGSYQAVKHLLAEAQVRIEFARPVVHVAAAVCHDLDTASRARVSHAKLAAAAAADLACRTSVQVHGAMGYSWEVDVHLYLKRALALAGWWGDTTFHRRRVAARMLGGPIGPDLTFARGPEAA